jgi:hypothetical protein
MPICVAGPFEMGPPNAKDPPATRTVVVPVNVVAADPLPAPPLTSKTMSIGALAAGTENINSIRAGSAIKALKNFIPLGLALHPSF